MHEHGQCCACDNSYSQLIINIYVILHAVTNLSLHTTFQSCHIHLPCLTTDWCPICRPHSDPVGCSWFQTTQCDTSVGPSHNPLILWSHHWGSSEVLSLIAHIVSCSTRHWGPGDTHCCSCCSSLCDGGGWLQGCVHWRRRHYFNVICCTHTN